MIYQGLVGIAQKLHQEEDALNTGLLSLELPRGAVLCPNVSWECYFEPQIFYKLSEMQYAIQAMYVNVSS